MPLVLVVRPTRPRQRREVPISTIQRERCNSRAPDLRCAVVRYACRSAQSIRMGPEENETTLETFVSVTSCDAGTSRAILEVRLLVGRLCQTLDDATTIDPRRLTLTRRRRRAAPVDRPVPPTYIRTRSPVPVPAPSSQHYKWDLDRAVDAFFDGSWQNALIDAAEAAALAASGASPPSPPVATIGGVQDLTDDPNDADYAPSPPGFATAAVPGEKDYHYVDDDDMEEQMLSSAVAASMDSRPRPLSRGTGDPGAPITIDDDNEDLQRALRESIGGGGGFDRRADHERDNRPPPSPAQHLMFGGGSEHGRGQMFGGGGVGTRGAPGINAASADANVDALIPGVSAAEREEARMLEAAMLGIPYEGPLPGAGGSLGVSGVGLGPAPSAEVAEARAVRNETDWAYEESLRADREKEAKRAAQREEEERIAAEKAVAEAMEAEAAAKAAAEREAAIAAANDALPNEPEAGAEGVVDVAVKLPDGRRVRRRFLKSNPLQAVFNFWSARNTLRRAPSVSSRSSREGRSKIMPGGRPRSRLRG